MYNVGYMYCIMLSDDIVHACTAEKNQTTQRNENALKIAIHVGLCRIHATDPYIWSRLRWNSSLRRANHSIIVSVLTLNEILLKCLKSTNCIRYNARDNESVASMPDCHGRPNKIIKYSEIRFDASGSIGRQRSVISGSKISFPHGPHQWNTWS